MISMEETTNQIIPDRPYQYHVKNEPVMQSALDVFTLVNKYNKVVLMAKGNSIPNAVAIANIIVEKMLRGASFIEKIILDSENSDSFGKKMLSTIEIFISKH